MSSSRFELESVCVLDRRDNQLHHEDLFGCSLLLYCICFVRNMHRLECVETIKKRHCLNFSFSIFLHTDRTSTNIIAIGKSFSLFCLTFDFLKKKKKIYLFKVYCFIGHISLLFTYHKFFLIFLVNLAINIRD